MTGELERVIGRPVPRETLEKLERYADLLRAENQRQNLISASSANQLWNRHILDSAQLTRFEPFGGATWVDIGSGAGLPGVVVAALVEGPVTLVEPRRLRAEFLQHVVSELGLNAEVIPSKAQQVQRKFDMITGRAVAKLDEFLRLSAHLSTGNTVWALPKGRGAHSELSEAQRRWQGVFHVEQSVTDDDSYIVVGTGVRAKAR